MFPPCDLKPGRAARVRSWDLCSISSKTNRGSQPRREAATANDDNDNLTSRNRTSNHTHFTEISQKWCAHLKNHAKNTPQLTRPGVHLRLQLPRRATSLAIPQIILRPWTAGLHEAHVEVPHSQHGAHRRLGRQADRRPVSGAVADDAAARFEEAAAGKYQAVEGYGDVQGEEACDGLACSGTEDKDTGETCFFLAGWMEICEGLWNCFADVISADYDREEVQPRGEDAMSLSLCLDYFPSWLSYCLAFSSAFPADRRTRRIHPPL